MKNTFQCSIKNLDAELFNGEVVSATVPTTAGEITILANHAPLISHVTTGVITLVTDEDKNTQEISVNEGIIHVKKSGVVEVMV